MPTATSTTFDGTYPGEAAQVARARHDVARYLEGCPCADEAVLVVSELVTNAVRHSRSRHATLAVHAERYHSYLWVEVRDDGGGWEPGGDDDGGRGLAIVSAVAADWGVDGDDRGRTVWARLEW